MQNARRTWFSERGERPCAPIEGASGRLAELALSGSAPALPRSSPGSGPPLCGLGGRWIGHLEAPAAPGPRRHGTCRARPAPLLHIRQAEGPGSGMRGMEAPAWSRAGGGGEVGPAAGGGPGPPPGANAWPRPCCRWRTYPAAGAEHDIPSLGQGGGEILGWYGDQWSLSAPSQGVQRHAQRRRSLSAFDPVRSPVTAAGPGPRRHET